MVKLITVETKNAPAISCNRKPLQSALRVFNAAISHLVAKMNATILIKSALIALSSKNGNQ